MGISLPQGGQHATRENVIQMAQKAEKEGFDSLWVFERLLWPINPQTPYPVTPDGSLPIEYQNVFDPLETLTYVAANTNKISLGTSVIDMLFHNPVYMGGFGPNTYSRIANSEANGWLGMILGPLEYLDNAIKTIKDIATKANKNPNNFKVILLTYPAHPEAFSTTAVTR